MNQTTTSLPPDKISRNGNGASQNPAAFSQIRDAKSASKHIQELMERVDSLPDAQSRELVHECLHSLLSLYGDGWARVLQLTKNAGVEGNKLRDALVQDKLVRSLLLIHGLHPLDLETRLLGALNKIRPYLESHGGNVELISLQDDVAMLRLQGTCKSCPSSSITLELAVRQSIEEACPDLLGFEVEGVEKLDMNAPGPCLAHVE